MTSARREIFARLHRSLRRGELTKDQKAILENRLAAPPRNVIPKRSQLPPLEQQALFEKMATFASASVARVDAAIDVPNEVRRFLREQDLLPSVILAPDRFITSLPWGNAQLHTQAGRPSPEDRVSVTGCFAGIAETGTICVLSGAHHPYTLNLTTETHIVVVKASQIVGTYEDAWDGMREVIGPGRMPRTVLWITGPSRTADIGQQMLFGAHGPKHLHIIIVESA